jgi:hypothetical protein
MRKKSELGARCIKKANGKYVVYREYPGDINDDCPRQRNRTLCHESGKVLKYQLCEGGDNSNLEEGIANCDLLSTCLLFCFRFTHFI